MLVIMAKKISITICAKSKMYKLNKQNAVSDFSFFGCIVIEDNQIHFILLKEIKNIESKKSEAKQILNSFEIHFNRLGVFEWCLLSKTVSVCIWVWVCLFHLFIVLLPPFQSVRATFGAEVRTNRLSESIYLPIIVIILILISDNRSPFNALSTMTTNDLFCNVPIIQFSACVFCT